MRWRCKSGVVDQESIVDLFEAVWRFVVGGGRGPRRDLVADDGLFGFRTVVVVMIPNGDAERTIEFSEAIRVDWRVT